MVVPSYEDKSKADWIGSEASQIESPTKCTSPLSQQFTEQHDGLYGERLLLG